MRHITILYGDNNTGKAYICLQAGWAVLSGTIDEMRGFLQANTAIDEFGVPLDTAEDQGVFIGPVRAMLHEHAHNNGYALRYIDIRVI